MSIIHFNSQALNLSTLSSFFAYDPYIERFWQPILGPTATGLLNLLALETLISDDFATSAFELSRRTGTGSREGGASPAIKQLKRLTSFSILRKTAENEYKISPQIPLLNSRQLGLLTPKERTHHEIWVERLVENPLQTQYNKATHLIIVMTMMGYATRSIKNALFNSGLHPSVIGQLTKMVPYADVS